MSEAFWTQLILSEKLDQRVIPINIFNQDHISFYIPQINFAFYHIYMRKTSFIIVFSISHELLFKPYLEFMRQISVMHPYLFNKNSKEIKIEKEIKLSNLVREFNGLVNNTLDKVISIYKNFTRQGTMSINFADIYSQNIWGYGSGAGSNPDFCKPYIHELQNIIATHNIKSIIDCGCGDWQYMRMVNLDGIDYKGFDVSQDIVTLDRAAYEKENVHFYHYGGNFNELPPGDLIICKDVLQHLPNTSIHQFLKNLNKYKYAIIANCRSTADAMNNIKDIKAGDYRDLDITLPPFSLEAERLIDIPSGKNRVKRFHFYCSEPSKDA